ncbi:MAG: hypothetical protein ACXWJM_03315 [Ramlibacter sp.]
MTRKDFTQTAFDVLKHAKGEHPKKPSPPPNPQKQTAPKGTKGAAKKSAKKAR